MTDSPNWLEHRTGLISFLHEALYENVPGGSRWRYVWGSALAFTFFVQVVTGVFLWMSYSPSAQTAWESVYYIQFEMTGGWLLRGLHHYTAQMMVVLLAVHLAQVVLDRAYQAPREVNFWLGLILALIVLALALTGYLLPWDQKGYWATKVATGIAGIVPVVGPWLERLVVGGPEYGHLTLTRFFALHAGVLPALLALFLVLHLALFRRHGVKAKDPHRAPDQFFWPHQVLKDAIACLVVLGIAFACVFFAGTELAAPANPAEEYPARPEWYFLFLFQMLKQPIFAGENEVWGAVILPGLVLLVLVGMPLWGRVKLGHWLNVGFLTFLFVGAAALTIQAMRQDQANEDFLAREAQEHVTAERVRVLAAGLGIPPAGAIQLLREDPLLQGPKLFARHCASCHSHASGNSSQDIVAEEVSAPNLHGFGTSGWIRGMLDPERIASADYFGNTIHAEGEMVAYVQDELSEEDPETVASIALALAAEGNNLASDEQDRTDEIEAGREYIADTCTNCHRFQEGDLEDYTAPDLTGYGGDEWLRGIIRDPAHLRFYGENNDRMPAFGTEDILKEEEIGLLSNWIRGNWYRPTSDTPEAAE